MKPLNIGLLIVGAGLAGGLAIRMTQPPPIPVPVVGPPLLPIEAPKTQALPVNVPPPVVATKPFVKPSPIPVIRATAPEAVYNEPPKPAIHKRETAIRKNEPLSMARMKPTQWVPGRYESTSEPASAPVAPAAIKKSAAVERSAVIEKSPEPVPAPAVEQVTRPAPRHQATLRPGMTIAIRLDESLSSDFSPAGGRFQGTLIEPLVADGFAIAERGARVTGRIIDSQKAGRSTGMSRLQLGLANLTTSDGQRVSLSTDPWMNLGDNLPAQTIIRFRLTSKVTITEQQIAGK